VADDEFDPGGHRPRYASVGGGPVASPTHIIGAGLSLGDIRLQRRADYRAVSKITAEIRPGSTLAAAPKLTTLSFTRASSDVLVNPRHIDHRLLFLRPRHRPRTGSGASLLDSWHYAGKQLSLN